MISPDFPIRQIRMAMNRAGGAILFYLLFSVIIGLFVGILSVFLSIIISTLNDPSNDIQDYSAFIENMAEDTLLNSLLLIISPLLALLAAFIGSALTRIKLKPLLKPSPLKGSTFIVIALITLGISCLASYLIYPIDAFFSFFNLTAQLPDFLEMPIGQPVLMVFYVIAICLAAPLAEEFLFRGVILHALKPFGSRFAIVISALFFGLIHGNFAQAPGAFLIGIALGVVTLRTGSLIPAIIIHTVNNTLSVLEGYLAQVTGLNDTLIFIVDAIIIIAAILLMVISWSKIRGFLHVTPSIQEPSIQEPPIQEPPIQEPSTQESFMQEPAQEPFPNDKGNFISEIYLSNEKLPFGYKRWYIFWTSWTMIIALISCVALLLIGGIKPL